MKKLFFLIAFVCFGFVVKSQDPVIDSLKAELKKVKNDTTKCEILNQLIEQEVDDNVWPKYNVSMKITAMTNLKKYKKGHPLYKVFSRYLAASINNIGYIYSIRGDVYNALNYYHQGVDIQREIGDKKGLATSYNNIGSIYNDQDDADKAFEYYKQALKIQEEISDKSGLAVTLLNLGFYYDNNLKDEEKALEYYHRSLDLSVELGDKPGQVYTMNNIGLTLDELGNEKLPIEYFTKALALAEETGYIEGVSHSMYCLATWYNQKKEYAKARNYALKSIETAKDQGVAQRMRDGYEILAKIYRNLNDFRNAYESQVTFMEMRDSLNNEQTKQISIKRELKNEYEIKAQVDRVKAFEEKRISDARNADRLKQERIMFIALAVILGLVVVFTIFVFQRYRVSRKQQKIIALKEQEAQNQRKLVEEKQKEIIDSINYAKGIQNAILTRTEEIQRHLPESFLMYRPKDIVAGDFHFFETAVNPENGHFCVFYGAADCTGHGVPGALVSVVCSNALTRCVKEFNLFDAAKLLDKARELVLETLMKSGRDVKDGMDISIVIIDKNTNSLSWAGANNPLWYLRNGQMNEINGDKQAIGFNPNPMPFTSHKLNLKKGDFLYMFTDGFADQFGGPKGKKFKYSKLSKLLSDIAGLEIGKQNKILNERFDEWKGDLEQIDDVCVIGVRV
ncbi:MAG TPA: tetratricopeptide repeat protein [Flavobacteriales bacterium]|nr:tetratricopeptide repeat protein [Flavobacteriales bacterium]